jgi:hypothetical protein
MKRVAKILKDMEGVANPKFKDKNIEAELAKQDLFLDYLEKSLKSRKLQLINLPKEIEEDERKLDKLKTYRKGFARVLSCLKYGDNSIVEL